MGRTSGCPLPNNGRDEGIVCVPVIPPLNFTQQEAANRQAWQHYEKKSNGAVTTVARETEVANRQEKMHHEERKQATVNNSNANTGGFSKGGGSTRCTEEELQALMDHMEDVLPIGKHEWERLTERCNSDNRVPNNRHRGLDNLRKQHNNHAKKKAPTGDPDCPPMVHRAKQILELVRQKAGSATMNNASAELPDYTRPTTANGGTAVSQIVAGNNNHSANDRDGNTTTNNNTNTNSSGQKPRRLVQDNTTGILKAHLVTEQVNAKCEACRAKMREKRHREDHKLCMQMAATTLSALATAVTARDRGADGGSLPPSVTIQPVPPQEDNSSNSDSSDNKSIDNPAPKSFQAKLEAAKKRKATSKANSADSSDNDKENDAGGSNNKGII